MSKNIVSTNGSIEIWGSVSGYGAIVAKNSIIVAKDVSSASLYSSEGEISIGGNVNNAAEIQAKNKISIEGNADFWIRINSLMGSVFIGKSTKGMGFLRAFLNISILGDAAHSGSMESTTGGIAIGKSIINVGEIIASKFIDVKGDVNNSEAIFSGGNFSVGGSTKGNSLITAVGNIKIGASATDGGMISKTGKIEIGDYVTGYCSLSANGDIVVKKNASNLGDIKSQLGSVLIEGDLAKECGNIEAYNHITIHGNKLSSKSIISHSGDITILGNTICNREQIKAYGKISTPNAVEKMNEKLSTVSRLHSESGSLCSDRYLCIIDDTIRFFSEGILIVDASFIYVESKVNENELTIDNKGHKSIKMHGGTITGLVDDALIDYNGKILKPKNGSICVDGFKKKYDVSKYKDHFFKDSSTYIDEKGSEKIYRSLEH